MWWLLLVLVVLGVVVLLARSTATPPSPPGAPSPPNPPSPSTGDGARRTGPRPFSESKARTARLQGGESLAPPVRTPSTMPGGPSWMSAGDWDGRMAAYRRQGRSAADIAGVAAHLERRGPRQPRPKPAGRKVTCDPGGKVAGGGHDGIVIGEDYVPKENESRFLTRNAAGHPTLRLLDARDRLAIWSPVDGGALINPKGAGLRHFGFYASYARGSDYHAAAYRAADLRKGRWLDLVREPGNVHGANAVMVCAPGTRTPLGCVQRGRAGAVARRIDAGEEMAAVSMRGPGPGRGDDTAFILIGSRADLTAMLAK